MALGEQAFQGGAMLHETPVDLRHLAGPVHRTDQDRERLLVVFRIPALRDRQLRTGVLRFLPARGGQYRNDQPRSHDDCTHLCHPLPYPLWATG